MKRIIIAVLIIASTILACGGEDEYSKPHRSDVQYPQNDGMINRKNR